jgi:hypothetical protein
VLRLFHDLLKEIAPSPLPKNKRLTTTEVEAYLAAADKKELAARRELLVEISNSIVEASLASVQNRLTEHWDGSIGVDATVIATFSRGVATERDYTATDPDAGWYVRSVKQTGKSQDRPHGLEGKSQRGKLRDKKVFGYDATFVIARNPFYEAKPQPNGCGDPANIPTLIKGFATDKPSVDPSPNGMIAVHSVQGRGYPPGRCAADAAFNNAKPTNWQITLRQTGYLPAYTYRKNQTGIADSVHGAIQVESTRYYPSMPLPRVDASVHHLRLTERHPHHIDKETWRARVDARAPYELAPKGKPDEKGQQQWMCPAAAGRDQCPLKPASMGSDPRLPLASPIPSPVGHPKICEQTSGYITPDPLPEQEAA